MKVSASVFKVLLILFVLSSAVSSPGCSPKPFSRKTEVVKPKKRIFPYNHAKHRYKKRTKRVKYTSH